MKINKGFLFWFLITFIPIILIILGYFFPSSFFSSQEAIRAYVLSFGIFAPLVFILLQIIQVVITPISHYAVSIAGGFIFGLWEGFLYNWIGRVVGTLIAFYLARIIGRTIVTKFVKSKTIAKYDKIFEKGKFILFLAYFLPLFPDDELSYLAGLSSMKSKVFIPIMMLGHIGGSLALSYVGEGIESFQDPLFIIISILTLLFGVLFLIFYKKIMKE